MIARLLVLAWGLASVLGAAPAGCVYTLTGIGSYSGGASNGGVTVSPDGPTCTWTASSPVNWITITLGSSGTGVGTVQFSIQANPDPAARSANLTVAAQSFNITQAGQPKTASDVRLQATPSLPSQGQSVTLTGIVTPSNATGNITFSDAGYTLATVTMSNGTAALATSSLSIGPHSLTATYNGDPAFASSTSPALALNVSNARTPTTTGLATTPNPGAPGQTVTLNVIVSPGAATGIVTFKEGSITLGTANLANGAAFIAISTLAAGSHSLTASYAGDANYGPSTSEAANQVINNGTTTSLTIAPNPAAVGQTVTFTAGVSPAAATGSVTFRDSTSVLGTVPLAGGSASLSTTTLVAGSHPITSVYSGDTAYNSSTSASVTALINTASIATATTLAATPNPATAGQTVTMTAAVSPSTATGTVIFKDGILPLSTLNLSNGSAIFATSTLTAGNHSLTASYSGDASRVASTSNPIAQVVNPASNTTTTTLTVAPNPAAVGQSVMLTAIVSPSTATGTVTFKDAATTLTTVNLSNGSASFASSALAEGTHSLSAAYSGDASFAVSASNVVSQVITSSAASVITLTTSPNPSVSGDLVALTATVTPAGATGSVTFKEGSNVLNTAALSNGGATFATASLPQGSHSLTAFYAGDSTHVAATSAAVTQFVNAPSAASVTLTAAPNPATVGQAVTLTAAVSPSSSTGNVTFKDGNATLGTVAVANGTASLPTSTLTAGVHLLTASYGAVTSAAVAEDINFATPTTTVLSASPNPVAAGQPVTLTAAVTPSTATGAILFKDGSTTLNTVSLVNGSATLVTSTLAGGSHPLTASYSGDATYAPGNSAILTEVVNVLSTTTALTTTPNPASVGQSVTLTAAVTPSSATGSVSFTDGVTTLTTVPLSNGSALFTTTSLAAGTHPLTAFYSGDATRAASTSVPVVQTVNALIVSSTALSVSPNPAVPGIAITLVAVVTPSDATGAVTFKDGSGTLSTVPLSNGSASFLTTSLPAGNHTLTASYSGDATRAASTSPVVTEAINSAATPTTILLSAAPNPASVGDQVTLTATVTPSAATGTVTFKDGAAVLSTIPLINGASTLVTSTLPAGNHSLTASYNGDSIRAASSSSAVIQVINSPGTATTTTVSATPNPASVGQTITFTATVTPSDATGNVTFKEGANALSVVPLAGGAASIQISALVAGSHSLTASYVGDSSHAGSTSAPLVEVVNTATATTTTLSAAPNPAAVGQSVTLTAAVLPSSATGTVTFKDGSTVINTVALSSGSATLAVSTLATGSHSLTANYNGSSTMAPSTSAALVETVTATKAAVTLTASPNPADFGQALTLTVTVVPSTATGTLIVSDAETGDILGPATLDKGTAKLTASTLKVGVHTLQASYSGDANNASGQSVAVAVTINPIPTTTALTASPISASPGDPVTFTATVSPSSATGTIAFKDGSTALGSATVSNGIVTYTTSSLPAGKHSVTAAYSGDKTYAASASSPVAVSIALPASTTALTVSPASSTFGQTVTLTATVTPASATGMVNILDGAVILGSVALRSGIAIYTTTTLAIGNHALSASYTGDSNCAASVSSTVTATVSKSASSVLLSVSPASTTAGQTVTLTANVTPSTATGAIAFFDSQSVLGTATLSSGAATLTTNSLPAGAHNLTAFYNGDTRTAAATSAPVSITVAPGSPVNISSLTDPPLAFIGLPWAQTFKVTGGTVPYKWSMSTTPDLVMTSSGDTANIAGTPKIAGGYDVTLRVQDATGQAATADFTLDVYPLPSVRITALQPASPSDQPKPQLSLDQPYPFPVTGTLTLSFTPAVAGLPAGYNDTQFSSGATSFQLNIPANSTTPSPAIPPLQLGSVAGDVTATLGSLSISGGGQNLPFPGAAPKVKITLPSLAPIIVPGSVRIVNVTPNGFQVFLDASSTTRDLIRGAFVFTAASGKTMNGCSPNCSITFGSDAVQWFAGADGIANGGTVSLTVPFAFTGDTGVIDKVAVTLTNSVGVSLPVSGGR